jgi:DNA-binding FadR family transcriptional regulator
VAGSAVRVPKAAEVVAEHVRERIVRGELHEGDHLPPESVLMAEMGISRPTLREAYRVLEADGLVSIRRGSPGGAVVHLPTEAASVRHAAMLLELRDTRETDVFEARAVIEAPIARYAARNARRAEIRALRAGLADEVQPHDRIAEVRAVNDFHRELFAMGRNQTLAFVANVIQGLVWRSAQDYARRTPHDGFRALMDQIHADHEALVERLEARDGDGAEALWATHLRRGQGVWRPSSRRSEPPGAGWGGP